MIGAASPVGPRVNRLGYLRDKMRARVGKKSSRLFLGANPTVPTNASLESFECSILDQGQSGSCTGHGTVQMLATGFKAMGAPLPWVPSPRGIYVNNRGLERTPNRQGVVPALTDSGAMPADIMTGLQVFGIRAMNPTRTPDGRYSDVWTAADTGSNSETNVNTEPTLDELEAENIKLVTGEARIDETASDFGTQIQAAIAAKQPVGIGVFVDTAFEQWNPSNGPMDAVNTNDPNGGGHWLALTSYETLASGIIVFRGPNSWSGIWGDGGHYMVTLNWLQQACSDCYLIGIGEGTILKEAA